MVKIDNETIKVATDKKAERMVRDGMASASLLRSRAPKQVKVLEDAGGKITVALYFGFPFYTEDSRGDKVLRTQQSIWMWDGAGMIRTSPLESTKITEYIDDEESAQTIFDSFKVPADVRKYARAYGVIMPDGIRLGKNGEYRRD